MNVCRKSKSPRTDDGSVAAVPSKRRRTLPGGNRGDLIVHPKCLVRIELVDDSSETEEDVFLPSVDNEVIMEEVVLVRDDLLGVFNEDVDMDSGVEC